VLEHKRERPLTLCDFQACAYIRTLPTYEKVPFETLYPDADPDGKPDIKRLLL
jgi:hypothetical protein